jgi:hypothetical protein
MGIQSLNIIRAMRHNIRISTFHPAIMLSLDHSIYVGGEALPFRHLAELVECLNLHQHRESVCGPVELSLAHYTALAK